MPPSPESLQALHAFARLSGRPLHELVAFPARRAPIQRVIHIAFVDLGDGTIMSAALHKPKVVNMRDRLRDVFKDVGLKKRWRTFVS